MASFFIAAAVAVVATLGVITRRQPVHALLYLVVSFLAVAVVIYTLGAPFIAALEVVIYAGAIIVLFLFVVMLLNLGQAPDARERSSGAAMLGAAVLAAVILGELVFLLARAPLPSPGAMVGPREVGMTLYGPYVLGVEIASVLLLAGAVGAFHLGRRDEQDAEALYAEHETRVPGGRRGPALVTAGGSRPRSPGPEPAEEPPAREAE